MTNPTLLKISSLRLQFREQILDFVDALEREGIVYAVGDALRDVTRERELWSKGRECLDYTVGWSNARAWHVTGKIVTNVFPGSGKGPHPYGLAIDIYPLDEHKQLMAQTHPRFARTIRRMHELAESFGIDALGSNNKHNRPCDEYWSGDPCHFQFCGWRQLVEKEKAVKAALEAAQHQV